MKNVNLSNEEVQAIDTMIRKIVYKKKGCGKLPLQMDVDDMISELWIRAMEIIQDKGSVQMGIIALGCYYRIVDITRSYARQPYFPIDPARFSYLLGEDDATDTNASGRGDSGTLVFVDTMTSKIEQPGESLPLDDILGLFEEGTKEYRYVKLMINACGARVTDPNDTPETSALEGYVSKRLGYASVSSSGYTRLRTRVRNTIKEKYLAKENN